MKNNYSVLLKNNTGCIFDECDGFTNLKNARSWASGRGQTHEFGVWKDYKVIISKNAEPFLEYMAR